MDDKSHDEVQMISFAAYESAQTRYEKIIVKMFFGFLATIILIVGGFLLYLNQFDVVGDSVTLESHEEGNASYMGDGASGVIDNGRSGSQAD